MAKSFLLVTASHALLSPLVSVPCYKIQFSVLLVFRFCGVSVSLFSLLITSKTYETWTISIFRHQEKTIYYHTVKTFIWIILKRKTVYLSASLSKTLTFITHLTIIFCISRYGSISLQTETPFPQPFNFHKVWKMKLENRQDRRII